MFNENYSSCELNDLQGMSRRIKVFDKRGFSLKEKIGHIMNYLVSNAGKIFVAMMYLLTIAFGVLVLIDLVLMMLGGGDIDVMFAGGLSFVGMVIASFIIKMMESL